MAADVAEHLRQEVALAGEEPLRRRPARRCRPHAWPVTSTRTNGGFGTAPKFPPSMVLELLLRHAARTGSPNASGMADQTLRAMARGGIYDQLAGGFARYSVDRGWVVPHFEKMLYDNALLLGVYVRWWRQSGDPLGERVARQTADFLLAELAHRPGRVRVRARRRHRGGRGQVLRLDAGPARRGARRRRRRLGGGSCSR